MKYRLHRSCDRPWQGQGGSPGKQRDTQFSDEAVDMPARQQLSAVGKSTQLSQPGKMGGGGGGLVTPKHVSRQWLTPHDDSPLARQSSAEGYTEHLRHDDAGGGGDGAAEQMKYDPPPGAGLATQLAGRHMKP